MKGIKIICCILIPLTLIIGVLSMPSSSSVENLPAVDFNNPYEINENAVGMMINSINEIRSLYGLSPVTASTVLNKSAKYKSLYISQYPDNLNASVFISGPLKNKGRADIYPYAKNEEVIYLNDGRYTQDGILATNLAKTLENSYTEGRIILNPNAKVIGISIVRYAYEGGSYTVCVIHSSDVSSIPEDVNVVPESIVKSDSTPPVVKTEEMYIAKDYAITKYKVDRAVSYYDNSGKECTLGYNLNVVDTSKIGTYDLNINVTDNAGNKTAAVLKVNVVPHVYPDITGNEIVLPIVGFSDIYDLAKYISIQDNYGIESVKTEPEFALAGDEGKNVNVTVVNKAGLISEKTLSIRFSNLPYFESPSVSVNSIYPAAGEPLSIEMIKSAVICEEDNATIDVDTESFNAIDRNEPGIYYCLAYVKVFRNGAYVSTNISVPVHIGGSGQKVSSAQLLSSGDVALKYSKLNKTGEVEAYAHLVFDTVTSYEGDLTYLFSFGKYGEAKYTINTKSASLIWNPESGGLYEIKVTVCSSGNTVLGSSSMNLHVSEKTFQETIIPYLELKPECAFVTDSVKGRLNNITEKLKVSDFLGNFVICDEGIPGLSVRVKNYQGDILGENAYVGTGSAIELYKGDTIYERYDIILYGDVNGDGAIDLSDYAFIRHFILGNVNLDGIRFIAANIAEKNTQLINLSDYAMLRQHLLGNYEIIQY